MHPTRRIIIACATAALALSSIGATSASAAADSRMTFINGIPGTPIKVCLNGKKAIHALQYGDYTSRVRDNGAWTLKVFKANPKKCRGTKLAQMDIPLNYQDLTIVITKKAPRILVWDDTPLTSAPGNGYLIWRHAAETGTVAFKYKLTLPPLPLTPSLDAPWEKGDQAGGSSQTHYEWKTFVTRVDKSKRITKAKTQKISEQMRHQWVYIGTKHTNDRLVALSRGFWEVP